MAEHPYTIYSASAGSGKTSTLVSAYLCILLKDERPRNFRQILAITFTNKAVNEMKERILWSLEAFTEDPLPGKAAYLFREVQESLGLEDEELKRRAARRLKEILHNYAFFDVSTIDKFNHRIIRTFARDLKLPQHFEVVLDSGQLLKEAVNRVLNRAGEDPLLSRFLIDFSIAKTEADKSWDLSYDLQKMGQQIFEENQAGALAALGGKGLEDFIALQQLLSDKITALARSISQLAGETLELLEEQQLETKHFMRGSFPNWLQKIAGGNLDFKWDSQWLQRFGEAPLYSKSQPEGIKATIDGLLPQLVTVVEAIRSRSREHSFLENAYKNMVPLAVLNVLYNEVEAIQKEKDLLPISFFNRLISDAVRDQPAPFIYERLGERYRHYFVDEFQDTSFMQWQNLVPLIGNALESEDEAGRRGSLMLVGDAKQAIYRWRGGKAEQFMELYNQRNNPFVLPPEKKNRDANYRSHRTIIEFNNAFFTRISSLLSSADYQQLYLEGNQQQTNHKEEGLVALQFLDPPKGEQSEAFCQAVLTQVQALLKENYAYEDICILTRGKKEGVQIADLLVEQGIPIISSETLLLASHPKVAFLINMLRLVHEPQNQEASYGVLAYLLRDAPDKHQQIAASFRRPAEFLKTGYGLDLYALQVTQVYDLLESLIGAFDLCPTSDAALNFLLDEALEVQQRSDGSLYSFLTYWKEQSEKLSLAAPDNMNAVRIMTVHKSKGLEFPVVIYPFATTDIYNSNKAHETTHWIPVDPGEFHGFPSLMINQRKEMPDYGPVAAAAYEEERRKLELDAFNLLYVALTRAEKGLYIITDKRDQLDKESGAPKYYSGLFIHYLREAGLWEEGRERYEFGKLPAPSTETGSLSPSPVPFLYSNRNRPAFNILTRAGSLWDTERGEAIERGTFMHHVLAGIVTAEDLPAILDALIRNGELSRTEREALENRVTAVLTHPDLLRFFEAGPEVRNEAAIITANGLLLRPDRLVIRGNQVSILDYKTGQRNPRYEEQVYAYSGALEAMGYQVEHRVIVYINETVSPEYI